jgi:hypothetical protein
LLVGALFLATIDRRTQFPRARKDARIVDRCFVLHHIRAAARAALHHVQVVAMEVFRRGQTKSDRSVKRRLSKRVSSKPPRRAVTSSLSGNDPDDWDKLA